MERFGWNLSLHTHTSHSPFPYLMERPSPIRLDYICKMVPSDSTAGASGSTALGVLFHLPSGSSWTDPFAKTFPAVVVLMHYQGASGSTAGASGSTAGSPSGSTAASSGSSARER